MREISTTESYGLEIYLNKNKFLHPKPLTIFYILNEKPFFYQKSVMDLVFKKIMKIKKALKKVAKIYQKVLKELCSLSTLL